MTLANGIETQDIEVWTEGSKIVFVGKPKAEEGSFIRIDRDTYKTDRLILELLF